MRLVVPRATAALDHPGYLLRPAASGLAVAAPSTSVTLFDHQLTRRARLAATGAIEDVALSPSGRLAALIDEEGLRVIETQRDGIRWRIVGKSFACHFSAANDALWVARPSNHQPGAWIELRDALNGGTRCKLHLPDPFGGSAFTLAPHADPRAIIAWIASEDGSTRSVSIVESAAGLLAHPLPLEDGFPPEPIPASPDYLIVQAGILQRRRWLDHAIADQLHWPWLDDEDLAILALDHRHALWASRTGRLHLIDHQEMTYLEEVSLAARPPRPLREYFPATDDPRWGTDLQQLATVGTSLVLQFGETLLYCLPLADLFD